MGIVQTRGATELDAGFRTHLYRDGDDCENAAELGRGYNISIGYAHGADGAHHRRHASEFAEMGGSRGFEWCLDDVSSCGLKGFNLIRGSLLLLLLLLFLFMCQNTDASPTL